MQSRFALIAALMLAGCTPAAAPPTNVAANDAEAPAAQLKRYRVGDATVTALIDGHAPFPANIFGGIERAESDALLRAGGESTTDKDGQFAWYGTVFAFLVETGGKRVLVDTGLGGPKLIEDLRAAGVAPEQIDAVVISHMHGDHIGGLLDAGGAPAFPRATLHLHADEAAFGRTSQGPAGQAASKILDAFGDRLRTFTGPVEIAPGFRSEPLPGHTPGHSLYRLTSGGAQMVFIGDMIHSLAVQMSRPDVTLTAFDNDQSAARAARAAFLSANTGRGVLFAGPHFLPGVVTIERDGQAYRATPVTPGR